ncbi:MAG TPA: hydrogenase maturation nickel metallochaperone HypA [Verrucomicrobiae bacterium]|jgi:hydrogenase nickel incorporation protein HypA/HybF|nr:hydrogenase maturation nickel metallochaperone HypA [Verrucomicrobiae bacterium]
MHEIGIASSILESVAAEAQRHPGAQVIAVGVRIGELSAVDKDALDFAFECITRETEWEHLKLEVEWCPRRQKCLACEEEFIVKDLNLVCPRCGADNSTCIGGTELDIAYLELEEPCAKS